MASIDCLWRSCSTVSIHYLAASNSTFCCCHALDNCCPFQHAVNIGDSVLLLKRFVKKSKFLLSVSVFQVIWIQYTYYGFVSFVAGWIGNDAVTPIIGEHDPYFHVYGRVS